MKNYSFFSQDQILDHLDYKCHLLYNNLSCVKTQSSHCLRATSSVAGGVSEHQLQWGMFPSLLSQHIPAPHTHTGKKQWELMILNQAISQYMIRLVWCRCSTALLGTRVGSTSQSSPDSSTVFTKSLSVSCKYCWGHRKMLWCGRKDPWQGIIRKTELGKDSKSLVPTIR